MPEAHVKPFYMLETPKAQGATNAKILEDTRMDNQQITQLEFGWLAGIVDGEGYIGIQYYETRNGHMSVTAEFSICNTDEEIIIKAQKIIQKMGINPYINGSSYKLKNKPNHKQVWKLVIHRLNKVISVLEPIFPYLTGTKKERAILVLEFCKSRLSHFVWGSNKNIMTDREIEIIESCITKQKRGISETTRKAQLENSELQRQKSESRRNSINGRYSHYSIGDDIVQPFAKA